MNIQDILEADNIADELDDETLLEIGKEVVRGFEADLSSRSSWEDQTQEWMKLALQVKEEKTYPWKDAANIKYPLLTTAALQFHARAYPSLINGCDIVKAKPIKKAVEKALEPPTPTPMPTMGPPQGAPMGPQASSLPPPMAGAPGVPGGQGAPAPQGPDLREMAEKISSHMSYQVLYEMDDWEEDMDKLLLVLPIIGCAFKKVYFSPLKQKNCSELILPKDLVVNYWTKSLETASRKTHRLWYTPNEFLERQRMGVWKEYADVFGPGVNVERDSNVKAVIHKVTPPETDSMTPRQVLECHTSWDIDEDGYKEPYIITVDYETNKVLRIVPRFRSKDVRFHPKNPKKIAKITPIEYFTKYSFIPNPDGSFYDLGFGLLLGSINDAANTQLNILTDSGHLSTLQAGFLAKGLRLGKSGDYQFRPGEWKPVNNTFDDLKKGIFPLPVKEPSNVLFQLLGMLVQSGKELASIAEIFTGKMPGQNTPASTTMATIEQGLKVFTSIYKRVYRSMGKEFQRLFDLNAEYLDDGEEEYAYEKDGVMVDEVIDTKFYQDAKVKIVPAADPNMVTETQKMLQLQSMMEMAQFGNINPKELTRRGLEIHGISGVAKLMEMPPPQPPLEIQLLQMELQDKEKDRQLEMFKLQSEHAKRESEITLNIAKAKQLGDTEGAAMLEAQLEREKHQMEMQMKYMELMFKKQEHEMNMQFKQEDHALDRQVKESEAMLNLTTKERMAQQNIQHNERKNQQQLQQMKKKEAMSAGRNNKRGLGSMEKRQSNS